VSRTIFRLAVAALAFGVAAPVSAQDTDRVKELIQQALAQQAQPSQPAPAQGLNTPGGAVVNLTEEEAITRATERNLNIASERITPQTWDYSLAAAYAFYKPTVTSMVRTQSATQLPNTIFEGGTKVDSDTNNWNAGLQQQMRWAGGALNVNFNNSRNFSTGTNTAFNPSFNTGLTASYVQPLLRNRAIDNNRASLQTTKISQDISEINLSATVASILAETRKAYWELVYSYQGVEAAQRSLELAAKLVQDNQSRVEIGTMAPIDVVQAQAEEATRRQQLVIAQAGLRNNELALKRFIVSGTDDDLWRATINPVDRPAGTPQAVDLEPAVRNALSRRTDLTAARRNIDAANINIRALENQTKPQLDLQGTYQLAGRGGVFNRRSILDPTVTETFPGGYLDALKNIGNFDAPTWSLQVNFSYPLGTSAAEANVARSKLQLQQSLSQIKTTELQIATEVTAAALAVTNSLEAMQAAAVARELSDRRVEAAQSKFEVGMATNFEVVQAQRDLFEARIRELREQLNYQRALIDFERVQVSPR
jgi:outer membrane protein TolC